MHKTTRLLATDAKASTRLDGTVQDPWNERNFLGVVEDNRTLVVVLNLLATQGSELNVAVAHSDATGRLYLVPCSSAVPARGL